MADSPALLDTEPVALLHGVGSIVVAVVSYLVSHFALHVTPDVQWQVSLYLLAAYNVLAAKVSRSKVKPVVQAEAEITKLQHDVDLYKLALATASAIGVPKAGV